MVEGIVYDSWQDVADSDFPSHNGGNYEVAERVVGGRRVFLGRYSTLREFNERARTIESKSLF